MNYQLAVLLRSKSAVTTTILTFFSACCIRASCAIFIRYRVCDISSNSVSRHFRSHLSTLLGFLLPVTAAISIFGKPCSFNAVTILTQILRITPLVQHLDNCNLLERFSITLSIKCFPRTSFSQQSLLYLLLTHGLWEKMSNNLKLKQYILSMLHLGIHLSFHYHMHELS